MRRRAFLAGTSIGIAAPLTGCLGDSDSSDDDPGSSSNGSTDHASDDADPPAEATAGWSQFRSDAARTGASTAVGPDGGGRVRWWSNTVGSPTNPVIEDGTVYVGSGLTNESIFAFDKATGDRQWQTPIGNNVNRTLAVADGTVYLSAFDVYAVDAEAGEHSWPESGRLRFDSVRGLAFEDGTVFVAAGGGGPVVALERETGEKRWSRDIHAITAPSVADGRVFVVGNERLVAIDAESGETDWTESISRPGSPPAIAHGTVFVGTRESLVAHDAKTGDREWTLEGSFNDTDIAAFGETVYLTGRQQESGEEAPRALAVDAATGDTEWVADAAVGSGSAVVTEESVYISTDYRLYALDPETGDVQWWLRFQWPVGTPAVADGLLYVNVGGRLLAIETGDGRDGVWKADAEPIPDRNAAPPEPAYADTDFSFGLAGFDVSSDWEIAVDDGAPVDVSFSIEGDRIGEDESVAITLAVTNSGDEVLGFRGGIPGPFGIFSLQSADRRIDAWTPAYEESGSVSTTAYRGITTVDNLPAWTEIPPGETASESYTISDETHGIQPGTYEFSVAETLSPVDDGQDHDGWEFEVAGSVELSTSEADESEVVSDLVVADEVSLPAEFAGQFTVDVLEPVTDAHPGLIEVTFENDTDEGSWFASMRGWPFGSYVGHGPDGRRLALLPASTYAPGFVDRTDSGWWEPTLLPHESVVRGARSTAFDPRETITERFIVTTHPETDAPRDGDSYAFEQGFGDDGIDVTWGFVLSTLDPDE